MMTTRVLLAFRTNITGVRQFATNTAKKGGGASGKGKGNASSGKPSGTSNSKPGKGGE